MTVTLAQRSLYPNLNPIFRISTQYRPHHLSKARLLFSNSLSFHVHLAYAFHQTSQALTLRKARSPCLRRAQRNQRQRTTECLSSGSRPTINSRVLVLEALVRTITLPHQQVSKILLYFFKLSSHLLLNRGSQFIANLIQSWSHFLGFGQPPQNTGFGSSSNNAGGGLFGGTTTGFGSGGKSRSSVPFQSPPMICCRVALMF